MSNEIKIALANSQNLIMATAYVTNKTIRYEFGLISVLKNARSGISQVACSKIREQIKAGCKKHL